MNKDEESELEKYKTLLREAEQRRDEPGITNLKREINRLLDRNSDGSPKDNPYKQ